MRRSARSLTLALSFASVFCGRAAAQQPIDSAYTAKIRELTPTDPKWKGAASHLFLADAAQRVAARGGRIVNVDLTILCEAPRIGPHRDAIRNRVAEILGLDVARVSVKATTTERLGFTGRGEGLAAMASATVVVPA